MAPHQDAGTDPGSPGRVTAGLHGESYRQLRRRLLVKLLVAYATPLVILAAFFHYQYDATLREGIDNHLKSVAESHRNTVDLFLKERIANMRSVFRGAALADLPLKGDAEAALKSVLARLQSESRAFVDVGLFGPDGVQAAYAGPFPALKGRDYSGEPWFRELEDGERDRLVSDVYMGFRGRPHFIIAVRREEPEGRWVLRASVDPEQFGEFIRSSHLAEEADAFIVNRTGELQTAAPGATARCELPVPLRPAPEARVLEARCEDGTLFLCAYASLSEIDWCLVARVPAVRAYAPLRHARWSLTGIMLIALGLITWLGFRNTRSLVDQLERADETKKELQGQLVNAAKLASVGEMAAGVAHEINNPLAIIHEEAGMMLDILSPEFGGTPDMAEFEERLREITQAAMRGRGITSKLLAFARRHDTVPEPTDLNALLSHVLGMKETEFRVSNIEVERHLDPALPTVLANVNQLEQVFLNLLNNAKDAVQAKGRGLLRIETRQAGEEVRVEIEDDGCGMSEDQLERVFFPFFTTKEVGKGTGLGLSISYGIVESHGGRIEVKSRLGLGTKVTVVLPAPPPPARGTRWTRTRRSANA